LKEAGMSATSNPIPADRFAEALIELPLATLYAKASEIRNSIAHLESSNKQLAEFAAEDPDPVLADSVKENEEVILRMQERLHLIKLEVEGRGVPWVEPGSEAHGKQNGVSGQGEGQGDDGVHL
jgi:hypothetical protein